MKRIILGILVILSIFAVVGSVAAADNNISTVDNVESQVIQDKACFIEQTAEQTADNEISSENNNPSTISGVFKNNNQTKDYSNAICISSIDFVEPDENNNFVINVDYNKNSPYRWVIFEHSKGVDVCSTIDITNPDNDSTGTTSFTFHTEEEYFFVRLNLVDDSNNIKQTKIISKETHGYW